MNYAVSRDQCKIVGVHVSGSVPPELLLCLFYLRLSSQFQSQREVDQLESYIP